MKDKTVIVTGANSGLGFEATRKFAEKNALVVMACRSLEKGREAKEKIEEELDGAELEVRRIDLADLESVEKFAEEFKKNRNELHVLCNNAGVMAIPRKETADGFEMQLGVNHLGHFVLTAHLIEVLEETEGDTRVVTQSSMLHEDGDLDFDDLMMEEDYDKWAAYARSKLANILFGYELDRRLRQNDSGVKSVICHPGYASTNLQYKGPEEEGATLRLLVMKFANTFIAQSAEKGALPMLYAATSEQVEGGEYIGPDGVKKMRGYPEKQESSSESYDKDIAEELWNRSKSLTGVKFKL